MVPSFLTKPVVFDLLIFVSSVSLVSFSDGTFSSDKVVSHSVTISTSLPPPPFVIRTGVFRSPSRYTITPMVSTVFSPITGMYRCVPSSVSTSA